jgi:hypothetical protein
MKAKYYLFWLLWLSIPAYMVFFFKPTEIDEKANYSCSSECHTKAVIDQYYKREQPINPQTVWEFIKELI